MKVYVDDNNINNLDDLFQATNSYECWAGNCGDDLEIVSLANYTKQVREEVCEEIKKKSDVCFEQCKYENDEVITKTIYSIGEVQLDQIQGETEWE